MMCGQSGIEKGNCRLQVKSISQVNLTNAYFIKPNGSVNNGIIRANKDIAEKILKLTNYGYYVQAARDKVLGLLFEKENFSFNTFRFDASKRRGDWYRPREKREEHTVLIEKCKNCCLIILKGRFFREFFCLANYQSIRHYSGKVYIWTQGSYVYVKNPRKAELRESLTFLSSS